FKKYHHLIASCKLHDWKKAGGECHRNGPSEDRNLQTKNLFYAAAGDQTVLPSPVLPAVAAPPPAHAAAAVHISRHDTPPYRHRAPSTHRIVRTHLIKNGDKGEDVLAVQRALNRVLVGITRVRIDGIFGTATEAAVRLAQTKANIVSDGIVGRKTMRALDIFHHQHHHA
ncbi:peptidoglycan-binding protein, partial [Acetobacter sp. AN02]|uniref:peptidoglycan-binding domain-containing protein n=1 Tax=Acetobacter sp. AN02 TaxID=2894186 RepID=UPI0024344016